VKMNTWSFSSAPPYVFVAWYKESSSVPYTTFLFQFVHRVKTGIGLQVSALQPAIFSHERGVCSLFFMERSPFLVIVTCPACPGNLWEN
jgi:hypothetical protein